MLRTLIDRDSRKRIIRDIDETLVQCHRIEKGVVCTVGLGGKQASVH